MLEKISSLPLPEIPIRSMFCEENLKPLALSNLCPKYLSLALILSLLISLFSFSLSPPYQLPFFLLFFSLSFSIFLYIPIYLRKLYEKEIIAHLPFYLRKIAMALSCGASFKEALKLASDETPIGREFRKIYFDVEQGMDISKALEQFSERIKKQEVAKAVLQLISTYKSGEKGNALYRTADVLISEQKHNLKLFSSKSAFFGLFFVIVMVVLPTFLILLSILGSYGLFSFIPITVAQHVVLFIIPVIALLIIFIGRVQMPPRLYGQQNLSFDVFLLPLLAVPFIFILSSPLQILVTIIFANAIVWVLFYSNYAEESRRSKIEKLFLNSLLSLSALPSHYTLESLLGFLAKQNNPIGSEAKKLMEDLKAGVDVEVVLVNFWKRTSSYLVNRFVDMALLVRKTGTNISAKMVELASDVLSFEELNNERTQALAINKYTMLLGAILLPIILGTTFSFSEVFSSITSNSLNTPSIIHTVWAYLLIYSSLSSFYFSDIEAPHLRYVYLSVMSLISSVVFFFMIGG